MSGMTLVILVVILAVVVIAIVLGVTMMQRSRLRALPEESRARYAQTWSAIQGRFIEDPRAAVSEADQMAVAMLRERGAPMEDERKMPRELMQARDAARTEEGSPGDTEGMRNAMLRYQHIVDDAIGESMRKPKETGRREVA